MYPVTIHYLQIQAKNHSYFLVFFFLGLFLNLNFNYVDVCNKTSLINRSDTVFTSENNVRIISGIVPPLVASNTQNIGKKLVRPRYYSTELGIKEKLFVGVLTSIEQLELRAVAINKTIAHLCDKVKFFMSASQRHGTVGRGLGNVVGFTDTRESLRPFHVIKYIADGFGHSYDYFFLMKDSSYVNAQRLHHIANRISVSQDVYMGTRAADGNYCILDGGILLSASVLAAARRDIEWCVRNAFSDNHGDNLGRCIAHSIGLECQQQVQAQSVTSYRLRHYSINRDLPRLSQSQAFHDATLFYSLSTAEDMYTAHAFRSGSAAARYHVKARSFARLVRSLQPSLPGAGHIPWPIGHRATNIPVTRFDVTRRIYFNLTHKYFRDDYSNVALMTLDERQDVERALALAVARTTSSSTQSLTYRRLVNGWAVWDLVRGLDYTLDVGFRDRATGKEVIRRFEVCKPLGRVEMLPMPYVTENKRMTILTVIREDEIEQGHQFLEGLVRSVMERPGQKIWLMFALLYGKDSASKGDADAFLPLKKIALEQTEKLRSLADGNKIAWVSIRLPGETWPVGSKDGLLQLATVDLALKKLGPDSLVLWLESTAEVSADFLNRVRMNTIANAQIFSAIPFRHYHPAVIVGGSSGSSGLASNVNGDRPQLHKTTGRFDTGHRFIVSFYGKDYINGE